MLKNVCFVMTAIAGLVLATGSFAADKPLADRHFNYGAQCATCHATKMPATGTRVKNETCLACHVSYEKLAEKTKTKNLIPIARILETFAARIVTVGTVLRDWFAMIAPNSI